MSRALPSEPWSLRVERLGDPDEPFITRTVVGKNLGGGEEVAILTTGSYRDDVEAVHAQLVMAAPKMLAALDRARAFIQLDRTAYADASVMADGTIDPSEQTGLAEYDAMLRTIDEAIAAATEVQP